MATIIGSARSHKIFINKLNTTITRKYESIIKAPSAPSALNYQIYKLQQKRYGGIFSKITTLNTWSARHPLILATSVMTIRCGICDWLAQCVIEQRDWDTFNWSRFTLFSLFGFFYLGFAQYGVYNKLYPMLFGRMKKGMVQNVTSTMVDMMIHSPLLYFPAFYIFKGFVYENSVSMDVVKKQLYQYFVINFKDDMIDLFKIWTPTIFIMFAAIPIS
eukprot:UN12845